MSEHDVKFILNDYENSTEFTVMLGLFRLDYMKACMPIPPDDFLRKETLHAYKNYLMILKCQ